MSLLVIDQEKCVRDGVCARECPIGIIAINGNGPAPVDDADQRCIHCGHCVAVCPHAALSLKTMPVEQCRPLQEGWKQTPEQVGQLLKGRRSVRTYTKQVVSREVLEEMIETASFAPTAKNLQPVEWLVVHESAKVKHLTGVVIEWMRSQAQENPFLAKAYGMAELVNAWDGGHDDILRNAPHLIVTHAPKENKIASLACTAALAYLELAALPHGVGTCLAGYFQIAASLSPAVHDALGLPETHQSFGAIMVGYPQFKYHRIPLRKTVQITWS